MTSRDSDSPRQPPAAWQQQLAFGDAKQFERFLGYSVAAFEATGYQPRNQDIYVNYSEPGKQVGRLSLRNDRTLFLFVFEDTHGNPIDTEDAKAHKQVLRSQFGDLRWECPPCAPLASGS